MIFSVIGSTATGFNGLQAHCPALAMRLQGISEQHLGKIPGNATFD